MSSPRILIVFGILVATGCGKPDGATTPSGEILMSGSRIESYQAPKNCPSAPMPQNQSVQPLPTDHPKAGAPVKVVPPHLPPCAELRHVNGLVDFEFTLETDGSVGDLKVIQEYPEGFGFAAADAKAFSHWIFTPKTVDGKPVASRAYYRFRSNIQ